MTIANILIISTFLGFIISLILDRIWFNINYKKIDKGFEVLEHYHFGIILMGVGLIIISVPIISYVIFGAGMGFIYSESKQLHYFAYKSGHFRNSSIIGVILLVIVISLVYFLLIH